MTLSQRAERAGPEDICAKCNGSGTYMYDHNHSKICEVCCPHDQGWQLLMKHYGDDNGKYCCKRGCGETRLPAEVGVDVPDFLPPKVTQ